MRLLISDDRSATIQVESNDEVWLAKCAASYFVRSRKLMEWLQSQNKKPDMSLMNYPLKAAEVHKGEKPQIVHRPEEVPNVLISLLKTALANATIDLATFKFINGNIRDTVRNELLNKAIQYADLKYKGIDDVVAHLENLLKSLLRPESNQSGGVMQYIKPPSKEETKALILAAAEIAIYILNSLIKQHSPYEIGFSLADSQYPESEWEKYEETRLAKIEASKQSGAKQFFRRFLS